MAESRARRKMSSRSSSSSKHDIKFLLNPCPESFSNFSKLASEQLPVEDSGRELNSAPQMEHDDQTSNKEHVGDRQHVCGICGFAFAQSSDRNKHVRTVHLGEKPFTCSLCLHSFGEKGNLNKHIRAVHQNQRPYKCSECPGQFAFRDGLARHRSMIHQEARPFKCEQPGCKKTFKQKAHAVKHNSSVHKRLKPCACFCGAAFRENYNLRLHQRSAHNIEPR